MPLFEEHLSLVLAHSVVFYTKEDLSPNGIVDDAVNGGDPPAVPAGETTAQMLAAYQANLPGFLQANAAGILPYEQAQLAASKQVAPGYQKLNNELYQQYAPQIANTEQQIQTNLLTNPNAAKSIEASTALQRLADPEFYSTREAANSSLQGLLASLDPNRLTGGELSNVERSTNRSNIGAGVDNTGSNTAAIGSALRFDDRLTAKKSALSSALSNVPGILQASRSGMDAFQQVTGKPGQTQGANFLGVNQNLGQATAGMGNNLYNSISAASQQANDINSNRRDSLDRATGVMGSISC